MTPFRLTRKTIHFAERAFIARHQIGKQQLTSAQIENELKVLYESLNNKYVTHWGCVDSDSRFMGYLTQVFSPLVYKHWLMSFLCTNPEVGARWDYKRNGMDTLWRCAIAAGKQHQCTSILYSLPAAWQFTADRTRKTSSVWKSYELFSFSTVKAGEMPILPFDKWVFGQNIKTYDVILRCAWEVKKPAREMLEAHRVPIAAPTDG